jgi:cyclopropane-fatty-acyl-phospholipid synthase
MSPSPHNASDTTKATPVPRSAQFILRQLAPLSQGELSLTLPNGELRRLGNPHATLAPAQLTVHDWGVFTSIVRGGDIAFAECFMAQRVDTRQLPDLLKLLVANRATLEQAIYGTWWGSLFDRLQHWLRANTKAQARKNIAAHYDLGNAFYTLWLDPSMTYSAALFGTPYCADATQDEARLAPAQQAKYERVLSELALTTSAHILEIGCGWGGFAQVASAAQHRVTGLTLSTEQLAYANTRLQAQVAAQQVNLKLQDYRDEGIAGSVSKEQGGEQQGKQQGGKYDGIASIEMFEAVGEQYWPSYFECIARNLKAGGKACIQTIVIRDDLFERYRRGTDFIQRYIFPGGMLPSPAVFARYAAAAGLTVVNTHAFGKDYARTLAVWRLCFLRELNAVKTQGYPERFIRMWEFYLAYCEAGFVGGDIDVVQFTLTK